jgi:hypothetical protein
MQIDAKICAIYVLFSGEIQYVNQQRQDNVATPLDCFAGVLPGHLLAGG